MEGLNLPLVAPRSKFALVVRDGVWGNKSKIASGIAKKVAARGKPPKLVAQDGLVETATARLLEQSAPTPARLEKNDAWGLRCKRVNRVPALAVDNGGPHSLVLRAKCA